MSGGISGWNRFFKSHTNIAEIIEPPSPGASPPTRQASLPVAQTRKKTILSRFTPNFLKSTKHQPIYQQQAVIFSTPALDAHDHTPRYPITTNEQQFFKLRLDIIKEPTEAEKMQEIEELMGQSHLTPAASSSQVAEKVSQNISPEDELIIGSLIRAGLSNTQIAEETGYKIENINQIRKDI